MRIQTNIQTSEVTEHPDAPPAIIPPSVLEAERIADIQAAAQSAIISHLPEGQPENFIIKELNLLMLDNELNDIVLTGGALTPEQEAQKVFFRSLKDKIKAIRDMSDISEANGDSVDKFKADLAAAGL